MFQLTVCRVKVVHKKEDTTTWMQLGKKNEVAGETEQAIAAYQQALKLNIRQELAYQRLMIIFRKQQDYKKELAIVEAAIAAFEKLQQDRLKASSKMVSRLSRRIAAFTGLAGKNGAALYEGQPLTRWKLRKELLKNKLRSIAAASKPARKKKA